MTVRVGIADDQPLIRTGLRAMIEHTDDLELIGEAEDGDQAIDLARRHRPDVVLMDIRMPRMDGITAAREIKAQHPHVKIIGLSEYAEGYQAHAMELAGAAGTYLKSAATEKLYEIIKRVWA